MGNSEPTAPSGKPRIVTRGFVLLFAINFLAVGAYFMLYSTMARYAILTFDCTDAIAGLTSSIFLIASVVLRPFAGRYGDRFGLKRTTIGATALMALSCLLYFATANNLPLLMITRVLHGASFGIANTTVPALLAKSLPKEVAGAGTGWFMLSNTVSTAIGPLVGMALGNSGRYYIIFVICAVCSVLAFVFSLLLAPDSPVSSIEAAGADGAPTGWRSFFDPDVIVLATFMFVMALAYSCLNAFVNNYSFEIGLEDVAPYIFLVNSLALLVTRPLAGVIMDRFGENTVIYPSMTMKAIGYVFVAYASSAFMLLGGNILLAVGWGNCMSVGLSIVARDIPQQRMTVAISTYYLMVDVGFGVGPFLLGFALTAVGFTNLYLLCGLITIAAMGIYTALHGRAHRGTQGAERA